MVSEAGIHTDLNKVVAIQNWPVPNSVREVKYFVNKEFEIKWRTSRYMQCVDTLSTVTPSYIIIY